MSYDASVNDTVFSERLLCAAKLNNFAAFEQVLIVHVASAEAFASAHVPGAVLLTPADLICGLAPCPGKLPAPEQLASALQNIGYHRDRDIIVYDDEGGGWAGRLLWTLDVIGHDRWWYLDGGIHAWVAAQQEIATGPATPDAAAEPTQISYNHNLLATTEELLDSLAMADPSLCVWDARSLEEHTGERSFATHPGRIPGSLHLDWLDLMNKEANFTLRRDLAAVLVDRGISREKSVVVHCQTHHRSGLAYLAARLLNYPDVRAYDGSWSEWGNRDDTPIETGPPRTRASLR